MDPFAPRDPHTGQRLDRTHRNPESRRSRRTTAPVMTPGRRNWDFMRQDDAPTGRHRAPVTLVEKIRRAARSAKAVAA